MTHTTTRDLVLELAEAIDADDWQEAERLSRELELAGIGGRARWDASSLATLFRTLGVLSSDMVAQTPTPPGQPMTVEDDDDDDDESELELELEDDDDDEERRQQLLRWSGR